MDYTREPIIETVITPKDGCTLVVRSSKNSGQEEYFVDAIEVVSFGNSFFFRSRERPKSFLVPVSDYELLEVRETRLVLKNVGFDRSIKIAGGREASRSTKEATAEKTSFTESKDPSRHADVPAQTPEGSEKPEVRLDKKRERRRNYKRKRDEQQTKEHEGHTGDSDEERSHSELTKPKELLADDDSDALPGIVTSVLSSLLPPPDNLISETIARYKDNALFKGVFFVKEEDKSPSADESKEIDEQVESPHVEDEKITLPTITLDQPKYGSFEVSEEEEEAIYQQRRAMRAAAQQRNPSAAEEPQHVDISTETMSEEPLSENSMPDPFPAEPAPVSLAATDEGHHHEDVVGEAEQPAHQEPPQAG